MTMSRESVVLPEQRWETVLLVLEYYLEEPVSDGNEEYITSLIGDIRGQVGESERSAISIDRGGLFLISKVCIHCHEELTEAEKLGIEEHECEGSL